MGTSTRNKGQSGRNTPLVPSWLDGNEFQGGVAQPVSDSQPAIQNPSPIPPNADPNRFMGSRTYMTRYITGGGIDSGKIRKAVSRYVSRSLGGSENATKRLGMARSSTARLYGVLMTLPSSGGVRKIEQHLLIGSVQGLSAVDFFIRIATFICPDGGPNDEGMARSAYFDTISNNEILINKPIENLTYKECELVLQRFMCKVIMEHIVNDIANKIIVLPDDVDLVARIEEEIEQMIWQSVFDVFVTMRQVDTVVSDLEAQEITDKVYRKIYEILESLDD